MTRSEGAVDLTAALRRIFHENRGELARQVADVEGAAAAAVAGDLDPDTADLARRQAHKLAGAGGMFGLHRTSEVARGLERGFAAPRLDDPGWVTRVAELVVALVDALDEEVAASDLADPGPAHDPEVEATGPLLAVALGDDEVGSAVTAEATGRGWRVLRLAGVGALEEAVRPDAALVGGLGTTPPAEAVQLVTALGAGSEPVPTIVVTTPAGELDRVEAARGGASGFLTMPVEASRAIDAVEELLRERRLDGVTILAVDDDPGVLAVLDRVLTDRGVVVEAVGDAQGFWPRLTKSEPDLLVLDVDLPGASGIELCEAVRADPRWDHLPILFLTAHRDATTVDRVFRAGADDYVSKPVDGHELVARIGTRLERIRLARRLEEVDQLTGTASRSRAHAGMEVLAARADDWGEPLSVAVVDLDDFRAVNAAHGHVLGDQVLRTLGARLSTTVASGGLVARWAGQEFLLALPGMSRIDAVDLVAGVLEHHRDDRFGPATRRFGCTFSAGVARHGVDGDDLHALYLAAADAAQAAKAAGGNRVLATGQRGTGGRTHDVVVVEDDTTLAAVLVHALRTRGWRTHVLHDGERAAEELAADPPVVVAGVVVLDWDLPGLDGPSVLRRLARRGVLRTTRVVMLTGHAQEEEVLRSLELGAHDHVTKPFSIPVLMQRIRRALAS